MILFVVGVILIFIFTVLIIYTVRHYCFLWNRLFGKQRRDFQDFPSNYQPCVSVLVPMHNEEKVAANILSRLVEMDYPRNRYEVIVIDDHSKDRTGQIADDYASKYDFIKVVHRTEGKNRGKASALKVGTIFASHEIILVFDADYQPSKNCVQRLTAPFCDVAVGLVMGRVVPLNAPDSFLTRMLDLERSGGYQVDQQARYNLNLLPQYGGTVGGVRKNILKIVGGWDVAKLAEDTDITYRVFLNGWKVTYVNIAECYEEVVHNWRERRGQLRRWAIGHNQCLFAYFWKTATSSILKFVQKVDGLLLLSVYVIPVLMVAGWLLGIYLYFFGAYWWWLLFAALLFTLAYNNVGNFAVFCEVGTSVVLDRRGRVAWLLPFNLFNFFANMWVCTGAFFITLFEGLKGGAKAEHALEWEKTKRASDVEILGAEAIKSEDVLKSQAIENGAVEESKTAEKEVVEESQTIEEQETEEPKFADLNSALKEAYRMMKNENYRDAVAAFKCAIQVAEDVTATAMLKVELGKAYFILGEKKNAIQELSKASKICADCGNEALRREVEGVLNKLISSSGKES